MMSKSRLHDNEAQNARFTIIRHLEILLLYHQYCLLKPLSLSLAGGGQGAAAAFGGADEQTEGGGGGRGEEGRAY